MINSIKKAAEFLLFASIVFMIGSCTANKKVADSNIMILPLSDTVKIIDGSIIYALPRTVLNLNVEMVHTIQLPGPYSAYAAEMLGLSDAILSENESWSITGLTVTNHEEADPSEYYIIQSNTLFQTNVLSLKKEGLILDLNPAAFTGNGRISSVNESVDQQFKAFDMGSDEYYQMQSDTAYRRVAVDSTFIRIPYIVENKKRLSVAQMAEKAAKRLMEMREGKHLILTGEANVFPQSDAPIIEMNRLEKEYTELFTGKSITEKRRFSFQMIPEKEMSGKTVQIFQFSEALGPLKQGASGGIAVTAEFTPEQKTKDLTLISEHSSPQSTTVYDKLYYRIPDVVNMKISLGKDLLLNSRHLVYQFGEVVQLPANYIIGK
jgi:hypothetical protein